MTCPYDFERYEALVARDDIPSGYDDGPDPSEYADLEPSNTQKEGPNHA